MQVVRGSVITTHRFTRPSSQRKGDSSKLISKIRGALAANSGSIFATMSATCSFKSDSSFANFSSRGRANAGKTTNPDVTTSVAVIDTAASRGRDAQVNTSRPGGVERSVDVITTLNIPDAPARMKCKSVSAVFCMEKDRR